MSEPALTALFFADYIIVEEQSKKKSVVGIFDRFHSPTFPVSFPPWSIFAGVTNLDEGEHNFALNLVSEQNEVIVAISGGFRVSTATSGVDLIPRIPQAIFPRAGTYRLTFHVDGEVLGQRLLQVMHLPGSTVLGIDPSKPPLLE